MTETFETSLAATAARVDAALDGLIPEREGDRLRAAMRHGLLGGGKRLRPFLVIRSAALFGVPEDDALSAACALECLHSYSLVHDDLPAMDDDDLRRGRPTVHRAFDEATAVLAGDALQTLAFEALADPRAHPDPAVRAGLVLELARASGMDGMAGGQMRDLEAEILTPGEEGTVELQRMKTGALFRFSTLAGAILAGRGERDRERMTRFGAALGAAFQIADDLLDEEATAEELGKAAGKDRDRGKATLPAILGRDAARARLDAHVSDAVEALEPYGSGADLLREAARFARDRRR